jgi:hypothetical protein
MSQNVRPGLLLKLRHPVDEHVACAGTVADEARYGIERPVHIPKDCRPVRNNHGHDQVLDGGHRKRLKIAAAQNRLIQPDQKSDQQNGEGHVAHGRDDVRRVNAAEGRVQELLEIKHDSA